VGLLPFHSFEGIENTVGYHPPQEIQLRVRCRETLELDALRPTKRIEKLFTVPVQTRLVGDVYRKHLPVRGRVGYVIILRIVRHEPLNPAKGWATALVSQNRVEFLLVLGIIEKLGQTRKKKGFLGHYSKSVSRF
jgi:hypothetical protein